MISSWLLYMCLCFTSLWYLPDYCTCTFVSLVYDIFLIIVHVPLFNQSDIFLIIVHVLLLHQSMISSRLLYMYLCFTKLIYSWLLYMCLCFTCLWYLPDYCAFTIASPVYDIFLIIVHLPLLHQFIISSWILYMWLCFPSLWCITIIKHVPLLFLSPDYFTCTFAVPVYIYL